MSAHLPCILYLRSEEKPELEGAYHQVANQEINKYPLWAREGGEGWIFSHLNCWYITDREAHVELAKRNGDHTIFDGYDLYSSYEHFGQSPSAIAHLGWELQTDLVVSGAPGCEFSSKFPTGLILSERRSPALPRWAEEYWSWERKKSNFRNWMVRSEGAEHTIEVMKNFMIERDRKSILELHSCVSGCVAAFSPDIEICVGDETIFANREELVRSSPFFSTMLKKDGEMLEATSKRITFPVADAQVIRRLLSLIYSSGVALDALKLSLCELTDVLAQAAEWQCDAIVDELRISVANALEHADVSTSLRCLKLASLHSNSNSKWNGLLIRAVEKVAEKCSGELNFLHEFPDDVIKRVLKSDKLAIEDDEGRVLFFVVAWVQKDQERLKKLPEMLKCIRFPFLRLACLSNEEKAAMRFVYEHAQQPLQELVNAAVSAQAGIKRGGEDGDSGARKRQCCSSMPGFNLGRVVCESFFSTL